MANLAWDMPEGMEPGLEASAFYDPPQLHVPVRRPYRGGRGGPADGPTSICSSTTRWTTAECRSNPMIVEGQVHGGVVQGVGPVLWEGAVYDDDGQLLTGSMLDYALPRADLLPEIKVMSNTTAPRRINPLGVKGIGEAGTIASTPTVYNAVMDALRPLGVTGIDMPLTPEKVWRAINESQKRRLGQCMQHRQLTIARARCRRRCRYSPATRGPRYWRAVTA